MVRLGFFSVFATIPIFLLLACVPNQQYRTEAHACTHETARGISSECGASFSHKFPEAEIGLNKYSIGIIELDDQGEFFDRKQFDTLLNEIEQLQNPVIVVYVHGWKHNASLGDNNLTEFSLLLDRISEDERERLQMAKSVFSKKIDFSALDSGDVKGFSKVFQLDSEALESYRKRGTTAIGGMDQIWKMVGDAIHHVNPRPIIGVYIGWRGASLTAPGLEQATFWGRKNAADRVGEGAVTEVLVKLDLLKREKNFLRKETLDASFSDKENLDASQHYFSNAMLPALPAELITIGHSMGASVVYASTSQLLLDRLVHSCFEPGLRADSQGCVASGFGDLIILINPAFEAMRFNAIHHLINDNQTIAFAPEQLPVFAIITSEADWATKYAFAIARGISTVLESERADDDQRQKNITAIGHYERYRTHTLSAMRKEKNIDCKAEKHNRVSVGNVMLQFFEALNGSERSSHDGNVELSNLGIRMERAKERKPNSPYLFFYTDKYLIPGHNEIYDCRIFLFLRLLIAFKLAGETF